MFEALADVGCAHYEDLPTSVSFAPSPTPSPACSVFVNARTSPLVVAHQIGHTMGLSNAGAANPSGAYVEYGDPQAAMGANWVFPSYTPAALEQMGVLRNNNDNVAGEILTWTPSRTVPVVIGSFLSGVNQAGMEGVAIKIASPQCVPQVKTPVDRSSNVVVTCLSHSAARMAARRTTFRQATKTNCSSTSSASSRRQNVEREVKCGRSCLQDNRGHRQQHVTSHFVSTFAATLEVSPPWLSTREARGRRHHVRPGRRPHHQRRNHPHQCHQPMHQRTNRRHCHQRARPQRRWQRSRLGTLARLIAPLGMPMSWMTPCANSPHKPFLWCTRRRSLRTGQITMDSGDLEAASCILRKPKYTSTMCRKEATSPTTIRSCAFLPPRRPRYHRRIRRRWPLHTHQR